MTINCKTRSPPMWMTINHKTRSPPMCLREDILGHLHQMPWSRHNQIMRVLPLEDSPIWSQWVIENIICNGVEKFFMHKQSDQQVVAAHSRTKGLNTWLHPASHVPNICDTLLDCKDLKPPEQSTKAFVQNSNKKQVPNCLIFVTKAASSVSLSRFIFIKPDQKCESPSFHSTWVSGSESSICCAVFACMYHLMWGAWIIIC